MCQSCDPGASLIEEKYRTFCKDQITECQIYQVDYRANGAVQRLERDFPNIDHALTGEDRINKIRKINFCLLYIKELQRNCSE